MTFLVDEGAFEQQAGGIVTMKYGVPIQVNGVAVDHLSVQAGQEHLRAALEAVPAGPLHVAPIEVLVFLKLTSLRARDRADLVELVKAGIDLEACRRYLDQNDPTLRPVFDGLIEVAEREQES